MTGCPQSIEIPLGQSTLVYISPTAVETDQSGLDLPEERRRCRQDSETEDLVVFGKYSRDQSGALSLVQISRATVL